MVVRILEAQPTSSPRDPMAMTASHQVRIRLAPDVIRVKTGTPLKPGPLGWVPAPAGVGAELVAGSSRAGGEEVMAFRTVTLETYEKQFTPSLHYAIKDIDDVGNLAWVPDPAGRFLALNETQILVDTSTGLGTAPGLTAGGVPDPAGKPTQDGEPEMGATHAT